MKSGCRICSLETSSQSPHKCSWKDNPHSVQQSSHLHPSLQVHSLEQQRALGGAGLGMSSSMRAGSAISPFLSSSDPTAFESKGSLAGEVAADEADLFGEIEVRALLVLEWKEWGERKRKVSFARIYPFQACIICTIWDPCSLTNVPPPL